VDLQYTGTVQRLQGPVLPSLKALPADRSHKPLGEVDGESVVREIRMLRLSWRELETWLVDSVRAPVLDPTLGGLELVTAPG